MQGEFQGCQGLFTSYLFNIMAFSRPQVKNGGAEQLSWLPQVQVGMVTRTIKREFYTSDQSRKERQVMQLRGVAL